MSEQKGRRAREIRMLYGDAVTVLPCAAIDAMERAGGIDCKILMILASDAQYRKGDEASMELLAQRAGCSLAEIDEAIAYWRGAGVLEYSAGETERKKSGRPKKQTPDEIIAEELQKRGSETATLPDTSSAPTETEERAPTKKLRRSDELPNYTMEELSQLLESRKNLSLFIDECQRAYGKMFNPRDISGVLGMLDYLSLDEAYILILLRHFGELPEAERKSLHYIERMAFSLVDSGITDAEALRVHLDLLKQMKENEGQIRSVFGMGSRAFTAKEKSAVLRWIGEFGSSMELIRLAYEKTVNATGKASIPYASKILERWHSEGLKTPADVENAEEKQSAQESANFETNEFFAAALRRSYGGALGDSDKENG